jgi:hypothetical protein
VTVAQPRKLSRLGRDSKSGFEIGLVGSGPAAARARQLKGLGLYAEDLCRLVRRSPEGEGGRDSVKEAQHFVLGFYFRQVPAGLIFSNHQRPVRSSSRALKLTRMVSCRIPRRV